MQDATTTPLPIDPNIDPNYAYIIDEYSKQTNKTAPTEFGSKLAIYATWSYRYMFQGHILSSTTDPANLKTSTNEEDREEFAHLVHKLQRINPQFLEHLKNKKTSFELISALKEIFESLQKSYIDSLADLTKKYFDAMQGDEASNANGKVFENYFERVMNMKASDINITRDDYDTSPSNALRALFNHKLLKIRAKLIQEKKDLRAALENLADSINYFSLRMGFNDVIVFDDEKNDKGLKTENIEISEAYDPNEAATQFEKLKKKSFWRAFFAVFFAIGAGIGSYFLLNTYLLGGNAAWLLAMTFGMMSLPVFYKLILQYYTPPTLKGAELVSDEPDESDPEPKKAAIKLNERYWQKFWTKVAIFFAVFVGIGEGGVIGICIGDALHGGALGWSLGMLAFIGGLAINYLLTRSDMTGVFHKAFFEELTEDENGNPITYKQKLLLGAAFFVCLCTGVAYAGVSAYYNYTLGLEPLMGRTLTAQILAGVPVLFTAVGMFAIFYKIMADLIINWDNRKKSIKDWWHENLTLVGAAQHEKSTRYQALQILKLVVSVSLAGLIGYLGLILFGGNVHTLFSGLLIGSAATIAAIVAWTNLTTAITFGVKNTNEILLPMGEDSIANIDSITAPQDKQIQAASTEKSKPTAILEDFHAWFKKNLEWFTNVFLLFNTIGVTYLFFGPAKQCANKLGNSDTPAKAAGKGLFVAAGAIAETNASLPGNANAAEDSRKVLDVKPVTNFWNKKDVAAPAENKHEATDIVPSPSFSNKS